MWMWEEMLYSRFRRQNIGRQVYVEELLSLKFIWGLNSAYFPFNIITGNLLCQTLSLLMIYLKFQKYFWDFSHSSCNAVKEYSGFHWSTCLTLPYLCLVLKIAGKLWYRRRRATKRHKFRMWVDWTRKISVICGAARTLEQFSAVLCKTIERFSLTFTANAKRETAGCCLS